MHDFNSESINSSNDSNVYYMRNENLSFDKSNAFNEISKLCLSVFSV